MDLRAVCLVRAMVLGIETRSLRCLEESVGGGLGTNRSLNRGQQTNSTSRDLKISFIDIPGWNKAGSRV
jgi:hypothetical protein